MKEGTLFTWATKDWWDYRGVAFLAIKTKQNTLVLNLYESLYPFFLLCYFKIIYSFSLRKQPTFRDAITGFPTNSSTPEIPRMTRHYADLGSASDLLKQIFSSLR